MQKLILAAKAFADPSRVRILVALRLQELCVCELCSALAMTQSTLSTHLQVIRKAGLVTARKEGKWMYYAIAPDAQPLLQSFFKNFETSLRSNPTLRRDEKKLRQRLTLRAGGSCCVGFKNPKSTAPCCQ